MMRKMTQRVLLFQEQIRFYKEFFTGDMAELAKDHYDVYCRCYEKLRHYGFDRQKTILDVGCGRKYSPSILFHSRGYRVTGIDLYYISTNRPPVKYYKSLRANGLVAAGGDFLDDILLKNRVYYKSLENLCGFRLTNSGLNLMQMSAEEMSFPDESFDLVISNCAFEHIRNVPTAISEIHRVLKTGGICHITIHLFTSLSGGHHFYWQNPDEVKKPYKITPWDHLRQKKHPLPPVYLNKRREREYLSPFKEEFEILEINRRKEGEKFLTPEILEELSKYLEDELLTRNLTIICKKV